MEGRGLARREELGCSKQSSSNRKQQWHMAEALRSGAEDTGNHTRREGEAEKSIAPDRIESCAHPASQPGGETETRGDAKGTWLLKARLNLTLWGKGRNMCPARRGKPLCIRGRATAQEERREVLPT